MSGESVAYQVPDVGTLAWEGDRKSEIDLTEEERRLLDGIAAFLFRIWPDDAPDGEDFVEREEFDEQRETVALFARLLQITVTDDDDEETLEMKITARLAEERAEGVKDATIPSRANTAERKAMRLLLERRVEIVKVEPETRFVHARVRGDSATYDCGFDGRTTSPWRCTCEELQGKCSHLTAVKMIVEISTRGAR